MTRKILFVTFTAVLLVSFVGCAKEKTYRVPQLHGPALHLKESELDRVTPLGWAMMLDMNTDAETLPAYGRQCQKDPQLEAEVARRFAARALIDEAAKTSVRSPVWVCRREAHGGQE